MRPASAAATILLLLAMMWSGCIGAGSDSGGHAIDAGTETDGGAEPGGRVDPGENTTSPPGPEERHQEDGEGPEETGLMTIEWGSYGDAVLRPGDVSLANGSARGLICTFGFFFVDRVAHKYYASFAGHCSSYVNETVYLYESGLEVGTVVARPYTGRGTVHTGQDIGLDFALIELHPNIPPQAHPRVIGWDGPVGFTGSDDVAIGDLAGMHGNGALTFYVPDNEDRTGLLTRYRDGIWGAGLPAAPGDSGSPVLHLDSDKALGLASGIFCCDVPPSTVEGPTIEYILDYIKEDFPNLELAHADGTTSSGRESE